jgi:hypothetical protein
MSGAHAFSNRAAAQVQVLATICALSRDSANPMVSLGDVEWGWAIVRRSLNTIRRDIANHLSGSDFESLVLAIRRAVKDADPHGISRTNLLRKKGVSKAKPQDVTAAIGRSVDLLLSSGD